jgi:hypothetical protein
VPLATATNALSGLVRMLSRLGGDRRPPLPDIAWYAEPVSDGRSLVRITGESRDGGDAAAVRLIQQRVLDVLSGPVWEIDATTAWYLSREVIEGAWALARLTIEADVAITLRACGRELALTAAQVEHARNLATKTYRSIGSVEGYIRSVEITKPEELRHSFTLAERLHGYLIPCSCDEALWHEAKAALGERVWVRGELHQVKTGRVVALRATTIRVAPRPEDLPQAKDLLGLIPYDPDAVWGRDAIRARYARTE